MKSNDRDEALKKNRDRAIPGPVLFDRKTIRQRVAELGTQISADYRGKKLHMIATLKGASIFHADLARAVTVDTSYDFMAVESYGRALHTNGEVRIVKDLNENLEGKDVLLIEDIIDSGVTLHCLQRCLLARMPNSLKIAVLLNKPSRRTIDIFADYVGFEIPDQFVVGYGMDYAECYRNLPDIHGLTVLPGF